MMTTVEMVGVLPLVASLNAAGAALEDLSEVNGQAAGIVQQTAAAAAPRRSGRLGSAGRATGTARAGIITFAAAAQAYAAVVHWGWARRHIIPNEFASEAAQRSQPVWLPLYETAVADIVATVHGAPH
jgi:hypothetical protein